MTKKEVKPRLKADLEKGKRITRWNDEPRYRTNCLPEFVRQLRASGFDVKTVKEKGKDGINYGVYVLKKFLRKNDVLWAK